MMKIVTLLFANVALLNFAKVGAMNDGTRERHAGIEVHPDINAWATHHHTHPPRVLSPIRYNPDLPENEILIGRVINRRMADWFLLSGELVHNAEVASCRGPHGYAVVELGDNERFHACLKPILFHNETISKEHTSGPQIYLAFIIRPGLPILEADLAPRNERSAFAVNGLLFHSPDSRETPGMRSFGRVRYVLPNNTEVDGNLYRYPSVTAPGPNPQST